MKPWIVDDTQENGRWRVRKQTVGGVVEAREFAAELLAWADENDVVMVPVPRKTVKWLANQATDSDTSPLGDVRRACKQLELG